MLYSLFPKISVLNDHAASCGHRIGNNLVSSVDEMSLIHEKTGEPLKRSVTTMRDLIEQDDKLVEVYLSPHKSMYKKQASNLVI